MSLVEPTRAICRRGVSRKGTKIHKCSLSTVGSELWARRARRVKNLIGVGHLQSSNVVSFMQMAMYFKDSI